ncbi:MAG TPA: hypothetical protein VES36_02060, partial [Candidatus Limnocylindrales bacterium]|nr:hypothetical protein [Candidatus Limnocylindrales bacterium]
TQGGHMRVTYVVHILAGALVLAFSFATLYAAKGGTLYRRNGMPALPFFMFGAVGTMASVGDLRMLRSGRPQGAARIARHLWCIRIRPFLRGIENVGAPETA